MSFKSRLEGWSHSLVWDIQSQSAPLQIYNVWWVNRMNTLGEIKPFRNYLFSLNRPTGMIQSLNWNVCQSCVRAISVPIYEHKKDTKINQIKYYCKEIQMWQGRNPGEITLWQPARREAGSCTNYFFTLYLHGREFLLFWWHNSYNKRPCPALVAPMH